MTARLTAQLVLLTLPLFLFAGCGGEGPPPDDQQPNTSDTSMSGAGDDHANTVAEEFGAAPPVSVERALQLTGVQVPEFHGLVVAGRRNQRTIRGDRQSADPTLVSRQLFTELARGHVPQIDLVVCAAGNQGLSIGRKRQRCDP